MRLSTEGLARASSRRPWLTIGFWVAGLVAGIVCIALLLPSALSSDRELPGSDFARGNQLIAEHLPGPEGDDIIVVRSDTQTSDDKTFRSRVEEITEQINRSGVARATNVYEDRRSALTAADRGATTISVRMLAADETQREEDVETLLDIVSAADGRGAFDVTITGSNILERDRSVLAAEDLQKGELFFGLPAALIILVLVFGALVGAFVPLVVAIVSIVVALALVALIGQIADQNLFIVNMLTGMGLALGIDYSLFIVSRYREERMRGRDKLEAIAASGATSGRAVFFSGLVFVLALLGMLLVPDSILRSLALGAILVGAVSVVAAMTFLPALLGLLGDRVNSLRVPLLGRTVDSAGAEGRFWSGAARVVMARPVLSLVLAAGLLIAASVPVLDLRIRDTGIAAFPDHLPSKQGFRALNEEFPGATAEPAQVVVAGDVSAPAIRDAIDRLEKSLETNAVYGTPSVERSDGNEIAVISIPLAGDASGDRAIAGIRELRGEHIPAAFAGVEAEVVVTGESAGTVASTDVMNRWLPIVIAFVLGLSFILLMIAFRSIVVPLKAIVLNLLSVGAAYGVVVLVFQKGVGADLLGFTQVESVESWVPPFLFSVLFGLSMDYHVFLLSRIRERFGLTGDNSEAVAYGVGSTARLITGAALIMVAVFTGFAIGDLVMFQQMGFGLAVALIVDATIVRSVLVPAGMELLGERNWYLPSWLDWLPRIDVEGTSEHSPPVPAPESGGVA